MVGLAKNMHLGLEMGYVVIRKALTMAQTGVEKAADKPAGAACR
jgi:hypothetical protein